jgi:chemotaxis signal transduction protein
VILDQKILNKRIEEKTQVKKSQIIFQAISFKLDNNIYAMDVMNIVEIIFAHKIYKVPNTDTRLLGVLNLRGNILPVYSLKTILGMEDSVADSKKIEIQEEDKFIIMIRKEKDTFGILIDAIYKNLAADEDNYRTGTFIEKWSKNSIFKGVILENSLEILIVNVESLLKYIVTLK